MRLQDTVVCQQRRVNPLVPMTGWFVPLPAGNMSGSGRLHAGTFDCTVKARDVAREKRTSTVQRTVDVIRLPQVKLAIVLQSAASEFQPPLLKTAEQYSVTMMVFYRALFVAPSATVDKVCTPGWKKLILKAG